MTNIDDLNKPSISEMSEEELLELLGNIRSNRRKQPEKSKKKTSGGGSKKSKKSSTSKLIENLTAEERQKLLDELGGKNDEN